MTYKIPALSSCVWVGMCAVERGRENDYVYNHRSPSESSSETQVTSFRPSAARTPQHRQRRGPSFEGTPRDSKKPTRRYPVTSNLPILQRSGFVYGSLDPHLWPFEDLPWKPTVTMTTTTTTATRTTTTTTTRCRLTHVSANIRATPTRSSLHMYTRIHAAHVKVQMWVLARPSRVACAPDIAIVLFADLPRFRTDGRSWVNEDKTFFSSRIQDWCIHVYTYMCVRVCVWFFRRTIRKVYSLCAWFIFDLLPLPHVHFPTYIPTYLSILPRFLSISLFISLVWFIFRRSDSEYSITVERVYEWKEILREMLPEPAAVLSPSSSNNRRIRSMYTGFVLTELRMKRMKWMGKYTRANIIAH